MDENNEDVERVNRLLKNSFGTNILGGNFRRRDPKGLAHEKYAKTEELGLVVRKRFLRKNYEFGHFDNGDGSSLIIHSRGFCCMNLLGVGTYERLYKSEFGEEANVRFEERKIT